MGKVLRENDLELLEKEVYATRMLHVEVYRTILANVVRPEFADKLSTKSLIDPIYWQPIIAGIFGDSFDSLKASTKIVNCVFNGSLIGVELLPYHASSLLIQFIERILGSKLLTAPHFVKSQIIPYICNLNVKNVQRKNAIITCMHFTILRQHNVLQKLILSLLSDYIQQNPVDYYELFKVRPVLLTQWMRMARLEMIYAFFTFRTEIDIVESLLFYFCTRFMHIFTMLGLVSISREEFGKFFSQLLLEIFDGNLTFFNTKLLQENFDDLNRSYSVVAKGNCTIFEYIVEAVCGRSFAMFTVGQ